MAFSILEYAANVRQKKLDLDRAITDLRHKNPSVEWTQYSIAVDDIMRGVDHAMDSAHTMLMVISRLVSESAKQDEHYAKVIADYESQISAQQDCIDKYEQDLHRADV